MKSSSLPPVAPVKIEADVRGLRALPDPVQEKLTGTSMSSTRTLHPFMAGELPGFAIDPALRIGLVPLVVDAPDADSTLAAYAGLYVEQEVQSEGLVRNVGAFAKFLEVASFSHGAVLNASNVARDAQVNRKTVENYLEICEDLLLAFRVPVLTRRARRLLTAHPKFYFFDAGVYRSLRPRGPLDRPEEVGGAALEGLVGQHLRAWIAYTGRDDALYFWRTRAGVEVDFIVYGSSGLMALEVKNAATVRTADVRPLQSFREDYPEAEPMLLYRGSDRLEIGGIPCVPVDDFLKQLTPGRGTFDDVGNPQGTELLAESGPHGRDRSD